MRDWRKVDMEADFLAKYNRGEISREQYLNQKKSMLMKEQAEQQSVLSAAQKSLYSINAQIVAIDTELAVLN